jgi:hypothetical protein
LKIRLGTLGKYAIRQGLVGVGGISVTGGANGKEKRKTNKWKRNKKVE